MVLSPAEKQRRYRERLKAGVHPVRYRKPRDRRSRAQRWRDAVAELLELKDHYANCFDSLPEALQGTAYGERLQAIAEADIEALEALELHPRLRARRMTQYGPLDHRNVTACQPMVSSTVPHRQPQTTPANSRNPIAKIR